MNKEAGIGALNQAQYAWRKMYGGPPHEDEVLAVKVEHVLHALDQLRHTNGVTMKDWTYNEDNILKVEFIDGSYMQFTPTRGESIVTAHARQ